MTKDKIRVGGGGAEASLLLFMITSCGQNETNKYCDSNQETHPYTSSQQNGGCMRSPVWCVCVHVGM